MAIGIIGGSGLYDMEGLRITREVSVATPFGEPSSAYRIGMLAEREVIFLPRHGAAHAIPPHRVNYRANLWGFKSLGVDRIIAVNAVGGINKALDPGIIMLPDQIIDMTSGRSFTFYEEGKVVHVDFSEPYCREMRAIGSVAAESLHLPLWTAGTYICTNGPRLETAKEIEAYGAMGADIVGMTAMPETILARELEMCFLCIAVVTNPAAGISREKLTTTEVVATMKASTDRVRELIKALIPMIPADRSCACSEALKDAGL